MLRWWRIRTGWTSLAGHLGLPTSSSRLVGGWKERGKHSQDCLAYPSMTVNGTGKI